MNAIFSRHSIRKYSEEEVSEKTLEQLLRAAMAAPSAGNEQPWHFIVIRDRSILAGFPKFHPHAGMAPEAACAIVICGDLSLEKHAGFWVQDCSAATENLLLEAQERGLGAVWVGLYPNEDRVKETRKLLHLPEHIIPLALVPIGHPAEKREVGDRFNPDRIHHDGW